MDQDKKEKIIVASSVTAGALIIIAGGIYAYIATRPVKIPDPQKDPKAARALLSSKDFSKLSKEQQAKFIRDMRPRQRPTREQMEQGRKEMQSMSEEQRRMMMQNMRKVQAREMEERLDKFFKMSKKEQLAELDRRIAESNKRRADFQRRRQQRSNNQRSANQQPGAQNRQQPPPAAAGAAPAPRNNNNNNGQAQNNNNRRGPSAQMRREFEASMSPAARAKMQQYRQMERLRREGKLK